VRVDDVIVAGVDHAARPDLLPVHHKLCFGAHGGTEQTECKQGGELCFAISDSHGANPVGLTPERDLRECGRVRVALVEVAPGSLRVLQLPLKRENRASKLQADSEGKIALPLTLVLVSHAWYSFTESLGCGT